MRRPAGLLLQIALAAVLLYSVAPGAVDPPAESLGFPPGADFRLADWKRITGYFRYLDSASDRVKVLDIGRSTEGRPMIAAVVTSEDNLARLDGLKEMVRALADPRQLTATEAERLIREARIVVAIGCNIHATEIASSQMALELAWELAVGEDRESESIRREVVLLIIPSLNPDGLDLVIDWYEKTLGTPYEGTTPPVIYHPYTGHDNNRDWFMITQAETRAVSKLLYRDWFPQIIYDVHQMGGVGARFFVPPFFDPVNPNIDPLLLREVAVIGDHMSLALTADGKSGVVDHAMYDTWWHGGFRTVPYRHNMVGILTEAASCNIASPVFIPYRSLRGGARGLPQYRPGVTFPLPWPGGWWRLRDIIDYELIASRALLEAAARYRTLFLGNFHRLGDAQVRSARAEPPYAYVVPREQDDFPAAIELLRVLARAGIEIQRAAGNFSAHGADYPAGTYVVRLDQPFGAHARDLLELQSYPDRRLYPGGPPERPYDVTGWTLGLMMGVRTVEVADGPIAAETELVSDPVPLPPGRVTGKGPWFAFAPRTNNAFRAVNRLIPGGIPVARATNNFAAVGRSWPPGTFLARAGGDVAGLGALADSLGIDFVGIGNRPAGSDYLELKPPALGLYRPWTRNMDEGWTRWVLERFNFPYRSLTDARIRGGGLFPEYRAIILPDMSEERMVGGNEPGSMPAEYTGGLGREGVTALERFVRDGGRLICLDTSGGAVCRLFGLPLEDLTSDRLSDEEEKVRKEFDCPGSILSLELDPGHPLAWGLGERCPIYFASSPVYRISEEEGSFGDNENGARPTAVGRYPGTNPLLSGWISGDRFLHGRAALVDCPLGNGRVVLIGFRAQHRAWTHGTFKLLFNAIYSGG